MKKPGRGRVSSFSAAGQAAFFAFDVRFLVACFLVDFLAIGAALSPFIESFFAIDDGVAGTAGVAGVAAADGVAGVAGTAGVAGVVCAVTAKAAADASRATSSFFMKEVLGIG